MGYDSLMINGDVRIEVRGLRVPRSGSGPGWWPASTPRRPCGRAGLLRHAIESAPVIGDQAESHPVLDRYPSLELARESEILVACFPLAQRRVPDDHMLRWIGESRRENFEIFAVDPGEAERDENPTDARTANPPWARAWNA